jgi:hypothetical protein
MESSTHGIKWGCNQLSWDNGPFFLLAFGSLCSCFFPSLIYSTLSCFYIYELLIWVGMGLFSWLLDL